MRSFAVGALVAVGVLSGCATQDVVVSNPSVPPVVSPAPVTFLASRAATGGMCAGGACDVTFSVSSDGTWTLTSSDATSAGTLSPSATAALVDATTATEIADAPPFTGTCPTAYDGNELVYAWRDAAGATQTVSACDRAIADDDPLVVALAAASAEADSASAPATDDLAQQAARTEAIAQTVVGLPEDEAVATIEGVSSVRLTTRIVARDGVSFPVTEDYSPQRVNLTVESGIVTSVSVG